MRAWPVRSLLFALLALTGFEAAPLPAAAEALTAEALVHEKLIVPLEKKEDERSRFSRAAQPPQARRLRLLPPHTDGAGRAFVPFAVDEKRSFGVVKIEDGPEDDWFRDAVMGCVYPESGEVLVRRGEAFYASSVLLGKPVTPASGVACRAR